MLFRKLTLGLALSLVVVSAFAQPITTGNSAVSANVDPITGLVTVYQGGTRLTYPGTSYLSVKIDGRYYTNNAAAAPTSLADPLGTGTTSRSPDMLLDSGTTTKIGEDIKTIWHDSTNNLDIIQTVYPVAFSGGAYIVISASVASAQPHIVQGQYLIDDLLGSVQSNPFIFNSNEYTGHDFDLHTSNVPSFFLEMESSPANPGMTGMIYLNDSFAPHPMGLIEPSAVCHLDWDVASDYTFGAPIQNGTTSDMASLIQWPTLNMKAGTTEIMRFAIGTSSAQQCSGAAVAFNFAPTSIDWNDTIQQYSPSVFRTLSLLYNPGSTALTNVNAFQSFGPFNNFKSLTPDTLHLSTLASNGTAVLQWTDSVANIPQGTSIYQTGIEINISATSLQSVFSNACGLSIGVKEEPVEDLRPVVLTTSTAGSFDGSECNARTVVKLAYSTGTTGVPLQSITPTLVTNMKVTVPPFGQADSVPFTVTVPDTMQDGIAVVRIVDANNRFRFDTTRYCTIADTSKPYVHASIATNVASIVATDTGAWQRGIDTMYVTDTANIIGNPATTSGACLPYSSLSLSSWDMNAISRALVHVIDCAGNETKYVYFVSPNDGVTADVMHRVRVFPNPWTDAFTLELPNQPTQVEIIDALGRTVAVFKAQGEYTFDASELAAGTYFLHAANTSQRLVKQ